MTQVAATPFDTAAIQRILDKYTEPAQSGSTPLLPGTFVGLSTSATGSSPTVLAGGYRDVEQQQQQRGKVDTDTRIAIASCTKLLVSLAVLSLTDDGRDGITIDSRVDRWLPELERGTAKVLVGFGDDGQPTFEDIEEGKDITVRLLLTHTNGTTYGFRDPAMDRYIREQKLPTVFDMVEDSITKVPLGKQPGVAWTYGHGIDWAGILIKRITGRPLGEYLTERFLAPLQMSSTSFYPSDLNTDRAATQIDSSSCGMRFHWRLPVDPSQEGNSNPLTVLRGEHPLLPTAVSDRSSIQFESGGGGLWSTASDYAKLLSWVLRLAKVAYGAPGASPDAACPLFRRDVAQLLFRPCTSVPGMAPVLAEENMLDPVRGYEDLSHTCGIAHFGTQAHPSLAAGAPANSAAVKATHSGISAGSLFWSGITQCFYIVDPIKDVAIFCATQLLPFGDREFRALMLDVHKEVYSHLPDASD